MKLIAAFMYITPGCDPEKQYAYIPGDNIDLYVAGVSTYEQSEAVAKVLEEKGCIAIELCAAFGTDGVARVKSAVSPQIYVGAVRFDVHPALDFKSGDAVFQ